MDAAASDGGTPPAGPLRRGAPTQPYMQLALYLAGNALTVIIGLLLWNLNTVLADFRDSMLYALLCSIALRPAKDWLVLHIDRGLADTRRSVAGAALSLAALPLTAVVEAWEEGRAVLAKWRQAVQEEFQRRQAALLKRGGGEAAGAPATPRTPRTAALAAAASSVAGAEPTAGHTTAAVAMHTLPSLAVYGHAAVKVLKSRRTSKKRRKARQQASRRAPEGSAVLFRWLLRTCAAWLLWEWVRDSWSATVQLALLVFTAMLAVGGVPLLLLTTNRYLSSAVFSPAKTPTASATQAGSRSRLLGPGQQRAAPLQAEPSAPGVAPRPQATAEGPKRRGSLQVVSPPKRPCFSPAAADVRQRRGGAQAAALPALSMDAAAGGAASGVRPWWGWCLASWRGVRVACDGLLEGLQAGLRSALRRNLHALVALLLILALFMGTTGLAAFLSVRVAQEGRATVLAVRHVFPTAWAGMVASTPLLADAVAATGDGAPEEISQGGEGGGLSGGRAGLPAWVAAYQREALGLVQQALPAVAGWAEAQFYGALERHNLTSALRDMRLLYETMQGPRQCSERERQRLVVALAKAEVALQGAREASQAAEQELRESRAALQGAVAQLDAARLEALAPQPGPAQPAAAGAKCTQAVPGEGWAEGECGDEAVAEAAAEEGQVQGGVRLDRRVLRLGEGVVAADASVAGAKQAHTLAALLLDGCQREQRASLARLQLCSGGRRGGQSGSLLPGLAGEVGAGLQRAYAKLWRRQLREGLADMRAVARLCASAARGLAQRSGDAVADLSALQRLAQAAADPLIAVGRVAGRLFAGSVGSTTAAALMGGLGVLRLGMGVVKFGMQLTLFLALLYYLLAAQADPLLAAAGLLPLSEAGRQRTAMALNRALGGVLVSSMKLIAFHGCFSWLTFRIMGLPLAYSASVASAVCALLPFVPTYAVALPGCVVLLAQGRLLASLLFFATHFMGYYIGDTAILEDIPGGHPYLLSLGILGGIYAFENPLQGCLLGPILLSLLSVFYNLHSEFMGSSGGVPPDGGGPMHRLWSITPRTAAHQTPGDPGHGLRVSVPVRRVQLAPEGGDMHSPEPRVTLGDDTPAAPAQQQQQSPGERAPSRHSLSLSLGDEGGAAAVASEGSDGDSCEPEGDSAANSFSFNPVTHDSDATKLHDD